MRHENETITGKVVMDGHDFVNCTFDDCTLVFSGIEVPSFHACTFGSVHFEFIGAAKNTIDFISMCFNDEGGGSQETLKHSYSILFGKLGA